MLEVRRARAHTLGWRNEFRMELQFIERRSNEMCVRMCFFCRSSNCRNDNDEIATEVH